MAGAQFQASSYLNPATILASQQQQPFVYQPPNTFASNAQVASIGGDQVINPNQQQNLNLNLNPNQQLPQAHDPYNIPANQLAATQQQLYNQQQIQQPGRPFSQQQQLQQQQQQQQQFNNSNSNSNRHYLSRQRSLPLPPPILQQLQARQQQQQLRRHYYQAANKLLFDDQRYHDSNPLLQLQDQPVGGHQLYSSLHSDTPCFNPVNNRYNQRSSRRQHYNLESTRGLNHSLQSQWLYGGNSGGRRSMAGDLLFSGSGQLSALGGVDAALGDADQKIVSEFCLLYNESRQLFNGLRWVFVFYILFFILFLF